MRLAISMYSTSMSEIPERSWQHLWAKLSARGIATGRGVVAVAHYIACSAEAANEAASEAESEAANEAESEAANEAANEAESEAANEAASEAAGEAESESVAGGECCVGVAGWQRGVVGRGCG